MARAISETPRALIRPGETVSGVLVDHCRTDGGDYFPIILGLSVAGEGTEVLNCTLRVHILGLLFILSDSERY